jgi:hypothetical protein
MPDITPDLVAQVASRLYNELPGEQSFPGTGSDSRRIAALLLERAQQDISVLPGSAGAVSAIPGNSDVLDRISQVFQFFINSSPTTATANPFAHNLLKSVNRHQTPTDISLIPAFRPRQHHDETKSCGHNPRISE